MDLQPLMSDASVKEGVVEPKLVRDFGTRSLCIVDDDGGNNPGQLVIYDVLFGDVSSGDMIKVKPIDGEDVIEVKKEHTKVLSSSSNDNDEIDIFKIVDDLVKADKPDALRLAFEQGIVDTNTMLTQSDGDSLLHYASRIGSKECLRYLLTEAFNEFPFDSTNEKGFNILHSAVKGGKIENVQILLDFLLKSDETSDGKNENINDFLIAKTTTGNNALHLCALFDKMEPIRPLLKAGVLLSDVDKNQNTLLHIAAEKSLLEFFERIANYHITDREDRSEALKELKDCFTLQNKDKKVAVMLTEDRPTIDIILKYSNIEAIVDKEVGRLLHVASSENNVTLTGSLVEKKADLNVPDTKGFSPLKIAAKRGNGEVLEVLLESGADPNFIGMKPSGFTPLNYAVQFGQFDCVKLLIKHGACLVDTNMTNTALHSAAYGGHAHIVEYLINVVGMDVNQRNNANWTSLYQTIIQGHSSVAKVLLHLGADPNVRLGKEAETLLHVAIREERKEIVRMLLQAKAKPDEPIKDGVTPLMMAVENDNADYIPLFMARGIALTKKDNQGNTLFHYAAKHNSRASAKYLLRRISRMRGITQEHQLYKNKNNDGDTPYNVAVNNRNEAVLKIFIGFAPKGYFHTNPEHIHKYLDNKLFGTIKEVMNKSIEVDQIAGGEDEGSIRILVTLIGSLLFAYPYSVASRRLSPSLQHLLNTVTGVAFLYYCYGIGIVHLLFDICLISVLLKVAGGTLGSVLFTWFWVFGHLLWGCSQEYLINGDLPRSWTTAHCVLTLKLIGVATSLYDAKTGRNVDENSSVDTEFALTSSKTQVLEVAGYSCLFCTSIIGPQLSFHRYRGFVDGTLYDREQVGGNVLYAINRAALAVLYIVIYLLTDPYVPSTGYFVSVEYASLSFLIKLFISGVWFFFTLRRFFIAYLIVEAACISYGISYKKKEDGKYDWTASTSVYIYRYESATSGHDITACINVSVQSWVVYYVYKRLKFMKSRPLSLFITMVFISLWHGVYPGFLLMFLNEVAVMMFENSVGKFFPRFIGDYQQSPLFVRVICYMLLFVYVNVILGSALLPFRLLSLERTLLYWEAICYFTPVSFCVEVVLSLLMDFLVEKFPQKIKEA